MAIGHPGLFYDINRDMYGGVDCQRAMEEERARAEYRRKEEEYRRQQALMQNPAYNPYVDQQKAKSTNTAPMPDTKDPLAFLQNTDKKLLLTGEMQ